MNIEERVDTLLDELGADHDMREEYLQLINWFFDKPQNYWLFAAEFYNWDSGILPLYFMIRSPQCSAAVAKEIFWDGDPTYYWCSSKCWHDDYPVSSEQKLLIEINSRFLDDKFVKDELTPTKQGFDEHGAAKIASSACQQAPQVAPELLSKMAPSFPTVPEEDHPTWNPKVADIFAALGTGF